MTSSSHTPQWHDEDKASAETMKADFQSSQREGESLRDYSHVIKRGSQIPGGGFSASNNQDKRPPELIGECPIVEVSMGGVTVPCLLDTVSMVSTIT